MYENGEGVDENNIDQAIYWYKKSAEKGNQDAQNKLKELLKINNRRNSSCRVN